MYMNDFFVIPICSRSRGQPCVTFEVPTTLRSPSTPVSKQMRGRVNQDNHEMSTFPRPSFRPSGYDGGDCCECTSEGYRDQNCDEFTRFASINPEAACVDDDDVTVDMLESCALDYIADGFCDLGRHIPECSECISGQRGVLYDTHVVCH